MNEMKDMYDVDLEMFSLEEVVQIMRFFSLFEKYIKNKHNPSELLEKYKAYQKTINNKSLEKQYDKMMTKKTGQSIFKTINAIRSQTKGKTPNETR